MPVLDLRRADRAMQRALEQLRRRPPASYPTPNAADAYADRIGSAGSSAVIDRTREAALEVLGDALELERRAGAAKLDAVEALRHLGAYSPSWRALGDRLGMSGQAAHKRFAELVDGPEPQRTIDDELAGR